MASTDLVWIQSRPVVEGRVLYDCSPVREWEIRDDVTDHRIESRRRQWATWSRDGEYEVSAVDEVDVPAAYRNVAAVDVERARSWVQDRGSQVNEHPCLLNLVEHHYDGGWPAFVAAGATKQPHLADLFV